MLHLFEVHKALGLDEVQVFFGVLGLIVVRFEVKAVFGTIILVVVVYRQVVVKIAAVYRDPSLIGPASRNIFYSVSATSKNHCWNIPALNKPNAVTMTFYSSVMSPKFISGQRVSATLQNDSVWPIMLLDFCHDRSEDFCELLVVYEWF